jgi:hypothetical protein
MKVGFRADNDLDRDIVRGLLRLEPNIDFEAELLDAIDASNLRDWNGYRAAHLIWLLTEAAEWRNRICYLPTMAEFIP